MEEGGRKGEKGGRKGVLMECKLRETHSSSGQAVIPVKVNNNFVS